MSKRRAKGRKKKGRMRIDPYFAYLVFLAVGVGTLRLEADARLTILWTALLAVSLYYIESQPLGSNYKLANVWRGAAAGGGVSLLFLLFAHQTLAAAAGQLFPFVGLPALFRALVLLAAPIEELYFRGILQREKGLLAAVALYSVGEVALYLPVTIGYPAVLVGVVLGAGLLGFVYGYVYDRYGLSASTACHATVNLVLWFLPALWAQIVAALA